jgi:hypothetical protein
MEVIKQTLTALAATALGVGLATGTYAASDAKKAEHAVSGAAHRVSEGYHKQVKDYHMRQAQHQAKKGRLGKAVRHAEKAEQHDTAQHKQHHEARVKEKAVKND